MFRLPAEEGQGECSANHADCSSLFPDQLSSAIWNGHNARNASSLGGSVRDIAKAYFSPKPYLLSPTILAHAMQDTPPSPPRSPAHHSSDNDTSSLTLKPRTTDDDTTLTLSATPTSGPVIVDHFLSLFLSDYLPKSHTLIIHNHQHGLSWAQYMPNMSKSLALNQALAAVSLAIVGRANEDERLIKQSFETYGMALGSLRRALMGRERGSEDTLATMMALKTYEVSCM